MHIDFLLEERSAEEALKSIIPKILPDDVGVSFHVFKGKQDLLKKLPDRLKGYRLWIPDDYRIVVLVDEDRENCLLLKEQLEKTAREVGFVTKSSAKQNAKFSIVNRIAIEELEAWFFGDITALRVAYPRVSESLQYQKKYRNPDAITGGTYEALERLLTRKQYYIDKLPKTTVAGKIAPHMEPNRNRFKKFSGVC